MRELQTTASRVYLQVWVLQMAFPAQKMEWRLRTLDTEQTRQDGPGVVTRRFLENLPCLTYQAVSLLRYSPSFELNIHTVKRLA